MQVIRCINKMKVQKEVIANGTVADFFPNYFGKNSCIGIIWKAHKTELCVCYKHYVNYRKRVHNFYLHVFSVLAAMRTPAVSCM